MALEPLEKSAIEVFLKYSEKVSLSLALLLFLASLALLFLPQDVLEPVGLGWIPVEHKNYVGLALLISFIMLGSKSLSAIGRYLNQKLVDREKAIQSEPSEKELERIFLELSDGERDLLMRVKQSRNPVIDTSTYESNVRGLVFRGLLVEKFELRAGRRGIFEVKAHVLRFLLNLPMK